MFDLDDRLQLLAERLARKEAPEKQAEREATRATTRRSLLPAERRANDEADRAVAQLKDDERGPHGVHRDRTLVDDPGSTGVDPRAWKRVISEQAVTASPMPPDIAARFQDQLPEDVSQYHFHTDAAADEICRAAQSEVVARGKDIFFRRGTPMPGTEKGDLLLAEAMGQLSVDARTAKGDQPLRRFVDAEPPEVRQPEEEIDQDPKSSGLGLLGLVGAVSAIKEGHDRRQEAKAAQADAELQRQRSEAEQRAKAAQDTAAANDLTKDLQHGKATKDQEAAAKSQMAPTGPEASSDLAELESAEKAQAKRLIEEMHEGAEHQLDQQQQLPDGTSEMVEERKEGLALFAATAAQMLDDVRQSRNQPDATQDRQEGETDGALDLQLGLEQPFQVEGNYAARWKQAENNTDAHAMDVDEHQLLIGTEVPDAAREFEENAFGPDLSTTVERIVSAVETRMAEESTQPHERERLQRDIDAQRPQLASVIETRVREAAEKNSSDQQQAEDELEVELEAAQGDQQSQETAGEDTFAFGARIDLTTGEVVVTTTDAIPTSVDSAPGTAAPSIAGGGDGGGGGTGGGGAGGGGASGGGGGA